MQQLPSRKTESAARRSRSRPVPRLRLSATPLPIRSEASSPLRLSTARAYALAIATGGVLTLAFPAPDIAPLAWITIAPLLVLAGRTPVRRSLGLGLAFGAAFFGLLLVWISIIGWVAWTVLVVVEAAFVAVFAAGWAIASRHESPAVRVVLAAALWVALEYLRSMAPVGGFTWGELAQSQHNLSWMLRPASLGGGWAVALLVMAVNALLAEAWTARATVRRGLVFCGLAAGLIALPFLLPGNSASGRPVRVAIVQGNVPRNFGGSVYDEELHIIESHRRLTERLAPKHPGLVVWPESAVGADPRHNPAARRAIARAARAVGSPMIVGANLDTSSSRYKVVALDVSSRGAIVDVYQKTHLVPFGEYVPARKWLGWIPLLDQIPTDAIAGRAPTLFRMAGGVVAPVVSFEGDFGSLVRQRVALGGRLVVVATNTSTWGRSWASAQHVASSQVRAAENGVWVVHASLSGISAFIAPDGRVVGAIPLWTRASMVETIRFARSVTFYSRTGDWLPVGCVGLSIIGLAAAWRRRAYRPARA